MTCVLVERVVDGPGPGEVTVRILLANGAKEEVTVPSTHLRSLHGGRMGVPVRVITRTENPVLIESAWETASGKWRLWVPDSQVKS